jgi:hypothetical protein
MLKAVQFILAVVVLFHVGKSLEAQRLLRETYWASTSVSMLMKLPHIFPSGLSNFSPFGLLNFYLTFKFVSYVATKAHTRQKLSDERQHEKYMNHEFYKTFFAYYIGAIQNVCAESITFLGFDMQESRLEEACFAYFKILALDPNSPQFFLLQPAVHKELTMIMNWRETRRIAHQVLYAVKELEDWHGDERLLFYFFKHYKTVLAALRMSKDALTDPMDPTAFNADTPIALFEDFIKYFMLICPDEAYQLPILEAAYLLRSRLERFNMADLWTFYIRPFIRAFERALSELESTYIYPTDSRPSSSRSSRIFDVYEWLSESELDVLKERCCALFLEESDSYFKEHLKFWYWPSKVMRKTLFEFVDPFHSFHILQHTGCISADEPISIALHQSLSLEGTFYTYFLSRCIHLVTEADTAASTWYCGRAGVLKFTKFGLEQLLNYNILLMQAGHLKSLLTDSQLADFWMTATDTVPRQLALNDYLNLSQLQPLFLFLQAWHVNHPKFSPDLSIYFFVLLCHQFSILSLTYTPVHDSALLVYRLGTFLTCQTTATGHFATAFQQLQRRYLSAHKTDAIVKHPSVILIQTFSHDLAAFQSYNSLHSDRNLSDFPSFLDYAANAGQVSKLCLVVELFLKASSQSTSPCLSTIILDVYQ